MKRLVWLISLLMLLTGCRSAPDTITVVSREDGSGTRGAFVDLLDIRRSVDGEMVDQTTVDAVFTNSTAVVMLTVSGDANAIGYMSVGSLNDTVKPIAIDGSTPTIDHIRSGEYPLSRPFVVLTKSTQTPVVEDFLRFLFSRPAQDVIADKRYVPVTDGEDFVSQCPEGAITIGGSSSVAPLIEYLIEVYADYNPKATVELQASDSTTGVLSTIDATYDIGLSSRALRAEEKSEDLVDYTVAYDGIAVVVHPDNPVEELRSEQVRRIFMGDITRWTEV